METMKAVVCPKYGPPDVLELREVEKPKPKNNELLIKIFATTVTAGDCEIRGFNLPTWIWLPARLGFGIRGPRQQILGQELAGKIVKVGKNVTRFKQGDQIFGSTGFSLGAYAEYVCLSENNILAEKPPELSFEEATTIPLGGLTALYFLRKANIQPNQKVLINGAGGTIGTYAVQLAKYYDAEVTAVDDTEKLDMLKSIGADHVIDYKIEDFTKISKKFDVIFDVIGGSSFSGSLRSLDKKGYYLNANPRLIQMIRGFWTNRISSKRVIIGVANENVEDLNFLKELLTSKKIKSVIDSQYSLEEIPEAHEYVEKGIKKGHVVITLDYKE